MNLPHPTTDLLDNVLSVYAQNPSRHNTAAILRALCNLLQEGSEIYIPIGCAPTSAQDLLLITSTAEDGKEYVQAYSSEVLTKLASPSPTCITAPLINYFNAVLQMEDIEGIVFNPSFDAPFAVQKPMLKQLLEEIAQHPNKNGMSFQKVDITTLKVDAIVNAADHALLGGGGVDGAIHSVAGPELLEECKQYNGCPTGEVRITKGYKLPAPFIIHTVGPIYDSKNSEQALQLGNCYYNSLELAREHHLHSIAFPAISCGVYGYPIDQACKIAMMTVVAWLKDHQDYGMEIIFACTDNKVYTTYQDIVGQAQENSKKAKF